MSLLDADANLDVSRSGDSAGAFLLALPPEFRQRFEMQKLLGRGATGAVFRAVERGLERPVAVKFLTSFDPTLAKRFLLEGQALARISHRNVLRVFDLDEVAGCPYLVTELAEGGSLESLMKSAPLAPARAVALAVAILDGLHACHAAGIVHRDLKLANVLLSEHEEPKLADFGLALYAAQSERLTRTGALLGTPRYIAPEVYCGEEAGPRADLYAVGVMLFQLLTGRPPYEATSLHELARMVTQGAVPDPCTLNAAVPPAVGEAVRRALAREPADRFADARAMAAALGPRKPSKPARPPLLSARTARVRAWPRRLVAGSALVVLACCAALVALTRRAPREPGVVQVSIERDGVQVDWERPGTVGRAEISGANGVTALTVAGSAPPRVRLPAPGEGPCMLSLRGDGVGLWDRSFTIPGNVEPKVELVGNLPGLHLRVEMPAETGRRARLFAEGQELAHAEAQAGLAVLVAPAPKRLPALRVEVELAPAVWLAREVGADCAKLIWLTALLERTDAGAVAALVRDRTLYDVHTRWTPDIAVGGLKPDNLAGALAKGLHSRAPRADQLPFAVERLAGDAIRPELEWLERHQGRLAKSDVPPAVFRRLHAALLRAVEPGDRVVISQYRAHTARWAALAAPHVTVAARLPAEDPPKGAMALTESVAVWRDREPMDDAWYQTWSVTHPQLELAFGPRWAERPEAKRQGLRTTRDYPLELPPAWRAGRVTLGVDVAMMAPQYALDVEIRGEAEALHLRLTHPGKPLWYFVMDGWPQKAAWLIGAGPNQAPGLRSEEVEQTLEWGTLQQSFPAAWLPARPRTLVMSYSAAPGLKGHDVVPKERVLFTRRVWLAADR